MIGQSEYCRKRRPVHLNLHSVQKSFSKWLFSIHKLQVLMRTETIGDWNDDFFYGYMTQIKINKSLNILSMTWSLEIFYEFTQSHTTVWNIYMYERMKKSLMHNNGTYIHFLLSWTFSIAVKWKKVKNEITFWLSSRFCSYLVS